MFVQIGFQIFLGVFVYPFVCFRKGIVDHSVKGNIPIYQRFDREQRVVDATQTPGRYQDNRQLLVGDVIDRQVSASNRNLKPPAPSSRTTSYLLWSIRVDSVIFSMGIMRSSISAAKCGEAG